MDDAAPGQDARPTPLARRTFLGAGGAALGLFLAGCSSDGGDGAASTTKPAGTASTTTVDGATTTTTATTGGEDLTSGTPSATVLTKADFAGLGACALSRPMMAGPFPSKALIERRDVTEGLDGHPVRLGLQVVDEACEPVAGAVVEVWHCDPTGDYSAYLDGSDDDAGEGTTFLRGSQEADADGIVEFHTIYPGWYTGRAVHVHVGVHVGTATPLVTQLFFADDLNRQVFATGAYAAHGDADTTNARDGISTGDPEAIGAQATTTDDDAIGGTRALLVLGLPAAP